MRVPAATYRLQFNSQFPFRAAREILAYLRDLGISHVYASPIFKARPGSTHGYDIVDPDSLNPELGAEEDFTSLIERLHELDMGWIQDIVPNHMAYDSRNRMLMDILENGSDSQYFNFFDIKWNHPTESIRGRLLAPFLGDFYGGCLEQGQIKLSYMEGGLEVSYYDLHLPLKIDSYATVFTHSLERLRQTLGPRHLDYVKLLGVLYTLRSIPKREESLERDEQVLFVKSLLWELYNENPDIRRFVDENIAIFNGVLGSPETFNLLDKLLGEQFFRLAFWKVGTEEINYRRFFYVNELILLKMDDESVFHRMHRLIFRLIEEGKFDGLRVDHIDGLYNPTRYLNRLRERAGDVYIVVEKILGPSEDLPDFWPVQGTTGYQFLNYVNGVLCRRESESRLDKIYRDFTGAGVNLARLVEVDKTLIIQKHMAGDIDNLAQVLAGITARYRYGRDFTINGLKRVLVEILARFPLYRTYISPEGRRPEDPGYLLEAVEGARQALPDFDREIDFIQLLLLLNFGENLNEEERAQWLDFVLRFQQISGPLMAKGFEDTALYVYNRLLSLNEVGGFPDQFGVSRIKFHFFNKQRSARWPHTMSATSTHDTKRGEDMRARLNVLSEIPEEWERMAILWRKINQGRKHRIHRQEAPDANDEYFLYQTLLGSYPFEGGDLKEYHKRINAYVIKAVREAKVHTTWLKVDTDYENAFLDFISAILRRGRRNLFLSEFLLFQKKIAHYGVFNSLSQTLMKIAAPGVPDFYQGTELWDLSLVDPDNRRPVDFNRRRELLDGLKAAPKDSLPALAQELLGHPEDGRVKMFLIWRALQARREHLDIFQQGSYAPVKTYGRWRDHVVAFARNHKNSWIVCVAPRFLTSLVKEKENPLGPAVWEDTRIEVPRGVPAWTEALTGRELDCCHDLALGEIFQHFPVALLMSKK